MFTASIMRDIMLFSTYSDLFELERTKAAEAKIRNSSDAGEPTSSSISDTLLFTYEEKKLGWDTILSCYKILGEQLTQIEDSAQISSKFPALNASSFKAINCLEREPKIGQDRDKMAQQMSASFGHASQLWKDVFSRDETAEWGSSQEIEAFVRRTRQIDLDLLGYERGVTQPDEDEDENLGFEYLVNHARSLVEKVKQAHDQQNALSTIFSLADSGVFHVLFSCGLVAGFSEAVHTFLVGPRGSTEAQEIVLIIDNLENPTARAHFSRLREWACQASQAGVIVDDEN